MYDLQKRVVLRNLYVYFLVDYLADYYMICWYCM